MQYLVSITLNANPIGLNAMQILSDSMQCKSYRTRCKSYWTQCNTSNNVCLDLQNCRYFIFNSAMLSCTLKYILLKLDNRLLLTLLVMTWHWVWHILLTYIILILLNDCKVQRFNDNYNLNKKFRVNIELSFIITKHGRLL
jgi:hypothetical protein